MILIMQCVNEEAYIKRLLPEVVVHDFCERIICIDGGSTDYSVQELKKFDKVEVYHHQWNDSYHDQNICQRNIALSYVPVGKTCFMLDFDERLSEWLVKLLTEVDTSGFDGDLGLISRRTFDLMRYPESPFCMYEPDGFPILSNQIGQFPDWQPRLIKRQVEHHWVNSPHHVLYGIKEQIQMDVEAHIIHYEKDDARHRERIEKKWLREQARRKMLGLTPDVFECKPKIEIAEYSNPDSWSW